MSNSSIWDLRSAVLPQVFNGCLKLNTSPKPTSYLPFGGGPRKCIGDMFASFEAIVAVSMLVRRFNFQVALGAPPISNSLVKSYYMIWGFVVVSLLVLLRYGGEDGVWSERNEERTQRLSRHEKSLGIYVKVRMTTGATIHTTEGLKMTVTRRTRPPIMPKLEKTVFEVDESTSGPEGETRLGPKSEVSSANS
ncbi:hypothetical protein NC653_031227 [Populus alba x Populus x berolinensis]|uniref:Cytochrome P450 n=1 Tax=Populus alba x Populus x berolinensis TaxID=444605 RepID=A0AAD6M0Q7_9ROSI|nr:hypothetical protein NC653_031227 [Populus alba x Populus x berolinensis]